jgi:hypothetical protein
MEKNVNIKKAVNVPIKATQLPRTAALLCKALVTVYFRQRTFTTKIVPYKLTDAY